MVFEAKDFTEVFLQLRRYFYHANIWWHESLVRFTGYWYWLWTLLYSISL